MKTLNEYNEEKRLSREATVNRGAGVLCPKCKIAGINSVMQYTEVSYPVIPSMIEVKCPLCNHVGGKLE